MSERGAEKGRYEPSTETEEEHTMTDNAEAVAQRTEFEEDIRATLNRNSVENGSGTPDHILARYLLVCLDNFDHAVRSRDAWWNYHPRIGGVIPAYDPVTEDQTA